MDSFDLNQDGKITFDEFKTVLTQLKELCQKDTKKATEYTSHLKMKEDRFKHKRIEYDVDQKFKTPLTFGQTSGFYLKDEQQREISKCVNHGIKQCNETKYAAEMVRTGFI